MKQPCCLQNALTIIRDATRSGIDLKYRLAPCAGHAHVHAADVRQEADLALGVAARQGDGNDVALLALKRIDGAHTEPALQHQDISHTNVWIFLWLNATMNHDRSSYRRKVIRIIGAGYWRKGKAIYEKEDRLHG
jgi:hypothetical protein